MPWWAFRAYEEGLAWEQPWIARVEMVEVDRPVLDEDVVESDSLAGLGFTVREG